MKKMPSLLYSGLLAVILAGQLAACSAKPPIAAIQTAIAGTQAAAPAQVIAVTQVVQVSRVIEVTSIIPSKTTDRLALPVATPTPSQTPTLTVTPTLSSDQTTPTPASAVITIQPGQPLGLSLSFFLSWYTGMTDIQKQEYVPTLPGKTVYWTAVVDNVTTDGRVILKLSEPLLGAITLMDVPHDLAVKISRGYWLDFTGTIAELTDELNLQIVIVNVKVRAFYPAPTLTPTQGRSRGW